MPKVFTIQKNVISHKKLIYRNLLANLVRHEQIVTTSAKAKAAQPFIEKVLSESIHQCKTLPAKIKGDAMYYHIKGFNYFEPKEKRECGHKILRELVARYPNRSAGFTRVIKLEPRLGEDKAPMSVIELVDSKYELKFWYIAKTVARLELQGVPLDDLTELNVKKLTEFRPNGEKEFREAVTVCKRKFFNEDKKTKEIPEEVQENLTNLPNMKMHTGDLKGKLLVSKRYLTKPRPEKEKTKGPSFPLSPFLKQKAKEAEQA
ncbi:54S ribosomal protein L8, mitochondrial [Candida viswanathii]|uniref:54S ribosomal protein L8, mitochondrial n=1 Tax=Candida viswanathii TaxID=5486 RepID=A0A367YKD7_9ASCO|nr:54S ribosomal protein L8, mitochondrial [Candida viswanathii]